MTEGRGFEDDSEARHRPISPGSDAAPPLPSGESDSVSELARLRIQREQISKEHARLREDLESAQRNLSVQAGECSRLRSEMARLTEERFRLREELKRTRDREAFQAGELARLGAMCDALREQRDHMEKSALQVEASLRRKASEIKALVAELWRVSDERNRLMRESGSRSGAEPPPGGEAAAAPPAQGLGPALESLVAGLDREMKDFLEWRKQMEVWSLDVRHREGLEAVFRKKEMLLFERRKALDALLAARESELLKREQRLDEEYRVKEKELIEMSLALDAERQVFEGESRRFQRREEALRRREEAFSREGEGGSRAGDAFRREGEELHRKAEELLRREEKLRSREAEVRRREEESRRGEAQSPRAQAKEEETTPAPDRVIEFHPPQPSEVAAGVDTAMVSVIAVLRSRITALEAEVQSASACRPPTVHPARAQSLFASLSRLQDHLRAMEEFFSPHSAPESQPLVPLVETCLKLWEPSFTKRGVAVMRRLAKDLPPVSANAHRFRQAFHQILQNAYDAMPRRGCLTVEVVREREESVLLCVRDMGKGFPSDILQDPFRPHPSRKSGKLGLGLALAQRILEGFGGSIELRNEKGGAAVALRLRTAPRA